MREIKCSNTQAVLPQMQPQLAALAKVGLSTVVDLAHERRKVAEPSIAALKAALEAAGVEFIAENGGGAGVRLRKE